MYVQNLELTLPLSWEAFGLIVFDMDSTLIDIECIDEIAKLVGKGEEVSSITEAAMRGEMSFEESLRLRLKTLAGVSETLLDKVNFQLQLNPGAEELVQSCQAKGLKTLLVSGGFSFFAERLQKRLGLDYSRSNVLEIENGYLTGRIVGTICDAQEKKKMVLETCAQLGLLPSQAIVVGDGANDLQMMSVAGLSVGYRPKPVVREKAQVIIDSSLDDLLTLFETNWSIRVPGSSANIGPGFDTLGLGLSIYLDLDVDVGVDVDVDVNVNANEKDPFIEIVHKGYGESSVNVDPKENLITSTAIRVAAFYKKTLPSMIIKCNNNIPLGSGLGSSGAAVVAGVVLANLVCDLGLTKDEIFDYCVMIEGHPDNVAASLFGGYVASYTGPERNCYIPLGISRDIKAITVTPEFSVETKLARSVLPDNYVRKDVVYNLQRVAVLSCALANANDALTIYHAMQDKIHQSYRQHLIPGLETMFKEITPDKYPGLLGICISGAGSTVLALANGNFDIIGQRMKDIFSNHGYHSEIRVNEIDRTGAVFKHKI
jgi:homoserine kinase/phosphoserine phosphatase SerB